MISMEKGGSSLVLALTLTVDELKQDVFVYFVVFAGFLIRYIVTVYES